MCRLFYLKRAKRASFSANRPASVWRGLQEITNYRRPSPHIEGNRELADNPNDFYCRFGKQTFTPITHSSIKQPLSPLAQPSLLPTNPPLSLRICEEDVCQLFRQHKTRKAPGPDGILPSCRKDFADQLAPIFTQIFNR